MDPLKTLAAVLAYAALVTAALDAWADSDFERYDDLSDHAARIARENDLTKAAARAARSWL